MENPFYHMAPEWALYPIVFLATIATVIASQALITGAFSLTRQAVQLGYLPRIEIRHTSSEEIGQIYIPGVNWVLMISCIALVLAFGSSSNLAAAYGVAVTSTMVITAILLYILEREKWGWSRPAAIAFTAFFLLIDFAFWGANIVKFTHGGWLPLVIGVVVFTSMTTWKRGRLILSERLRAGSMLFTTFTERLRADKFAHVQGTAVFMYSDPETTPPALLHNMKHNKVLHEQVVLLSVNTEEIPRVPSKERIEVHKLENGFYRVILHYGFMEDPNVPRDLARARKLGLEYKPSETTYFLGREHLFASKRPGMAIWRENLFAAMSRNARTATDFFRLPPDRVVELGSQVEM